MEVIKALAAVFAAFVFFLFSNLFLPNNNKRNKYVRHTIIGFAR